MTSLYKKKIRCRFATWGFKSLYPQNKIKLPILFFRMYWYICLQVKYKCWQSPLVYVGFALAKQGQSHHLLTNRRFVLAQKLMAFSQRTCTCKRTLTNRRFVFACRREQIYTNLRFVSVCLQIKDDGHTNLFTNLFAKRSWWPYKSSYKSLCKAKLCPCTCKANVSIR